MYIQTLGHTVETAADAETALGVIERQDFDLVMSDIRMEGLGGLGLLRQLRERQRDTAVVLMTAYATAARIAEAMSLGTTGATVADNRNSATRKGWSVPHYLIRAPPAPARGHVLREACRSRLHRAPLYYAPRS